MMTNVENRSFEGVAVNSIALLKGQGNENNQWEEEATVYNVSKNSIGFILNKDYKVGRLISVTAPNAKFKKENVNNSVWGVVQHCAPMSGNNPKGKYYLGMALIGEMPPVSYVANPLQSYKICGINENGFWRVEEAGKEFVVRKFPRFITNIEVFLGQLDDQSNLGKGERVVTDNISIAGLAVYSSLNLGIGDCVKIVASQYDFSGLAIVRNVTAKNNRKSKICLEFASARFPIEKVKDVIKLMQQAIA